MVQCPCSDAVVEVILVQKTTSLSHAEGSQSADLGRYFLVGDWRVKEQLVLVVCGQFPSWGMLCSLGWTMLGGGVWVMDLFAC